MIGIDWIATSLSIIGYFFVIKKHFIGLVIWTFANLLWIYIGLLNKTYGMVTLFIFYIFMNIYGVYGWRRVGS